MFETYEQFVNRTRHRFSVFDLREQSAENLADAENKFLAAEAKPEVTAKGEENCIAWYFVRSGESFYEVRRFFDWCFCSCESFFFSSKACKHIIATYEPLCRKCGYRSVSERGGQCSFCEAKYAPYIKQGTGRKPERIGNFRI